MSKKRDFIQSQQSRDKNPESGMAGSASDVTEKHMRAGNQRTSEQDRQEPGTPKNSNDHNKLGEKKPTQKNEGRRTPESRHDRETHVGGMNVVQARTGGKGGGRGTRGGNVGGKST